EHATWRRLGGSALELGPDALAGDRLEPAHALDELSARVEVGTQTQPRGVAGGTPDACGIVAKGFGVEHAQPPRDEVDETTGGVGELASTRAGERQSEGVHAE